MPRISCCRTAAVAALPLLVLSAQTVKPEEVVATVNGEKITAGMMQSLRHGAAQQFQKAVQQGNKEFLKSVAGLLALARKAEQEKVDQKEPYRDQLLFLKMNFLANAYISYLNTQVQITQKEIQDYFEKNKAEYEEAMVRAIYIAFSRSGGEDAEGRKRLTEAEAKAKAENLVAELKKGADFAALAKQHSDDKASAEQGGDIGGIKRASTGVPAEVRTAVFALKPGEVSEPLPQPAGYYIFKLDQIKTTPYEEAASAIATQLQSQKVQQEVQKILGSVEIRHVNEGFFADKQ
jgi:peptidyl-prolyl cis-trans isomerase C